MTRHPSQPEDKISPRTPREYPGEQPCSPRLQPCSPRLLSAHLEVPRDEAGLKALSKALRAEFQQLSEAELRISSQRARWTEAVALFLDRQDLLAEQAAKANNAGNCGSTEETEEPEQTPRGKLGGEAPLVPVLALSAMAQERPGPRISPPPMVAEMDEAAVFEEVGKPPVFAHWEETAVLDNGTNATPRNGLERSNSNVPSQNEGSQGNRSWEAKRRFDSSHALTLRPVNRDHHAESDFHRILRKLISHPAFDSTCAFMILLNSAIIGVNVEWLVSHDKEPLVNVVAGHVCTVFFLVELILRMTLFGRSFFFNENRGWNVFDFFLVFFSIVDFMMGIFVEDGSSSVAKNLKTIKMLRIIRVFRVFRFFRELSLLALMIVDSLYSLTWALILLMIIIYVFSICFTSMATDYIKEPDSEGTVVRDVGLLFGSLTKTIYTLVLSMLNGVSWGVASDALMEINFLAGGLFLFYVAFTLLAVMNIITGVFVDNAVETARTQRDFLIQKEMELKEKCANEMRGLFTEMDKDGSGTISYSEVETYLEDPRVQGYFAALGLDPNDTERLFRLIDDDGSGDVDVGEFLDGCIRLKGQARSIDVYALMRHMHDVEKKLDHLTEHLRCPPLIYEPLR